MKLWKMLYALPLVLMMGCVDDTRPISPYYTSTPVYGCVIVTDDLGEREVCNTYYTYTSNGVVYWDTTFNIWVGPGGYWYRGVWNRGYYPGYHAYYHGAYRGSGYYHGRGYGGFHGGGRGRR